MGHLSVSAGNEISIIKKIEIMENLSDIFDKEKEKKERERSAYVEKLKKNWEEYKRGAEKAFEKLSFLNERGYKIKLLAGAFNEQDARDDRYPKILVQDVTHVIKNDYHAEDEIGVSGLGKFSLSGEVHTYESFIKKLIS